MEDEYVCLDARITWSMHELLSIDLTNAAGMVTVSCFGSRATLCLQVGKLWIYDGVGAVCADFIELVGAGSL